MSIVGGLGSHHFIILLHEGASKASDQFGLLALRVRLYLFPQVRHHRRDSRLLQCHPRLHFLYYHSYHGTGTIYSNTIIVINNFSYSTLVFWVGFHQLERDDQREFINQLEEALCGYSQVWQVLSRLGLVSRFDYYRPIGRP